MDKIDPKIKKYLTEIARTRGGWKLIPGFKIQKACGNCAHYQNFYGEDTICQNPEYSKYFNWDGYGEVGIDLEIDDTGICPKYKRG